MIGTVEQVAAALGALTGIVMLLAMMAAGWVGRPQPRPVPVRTRR